MDFVPVSATITSSKEARAPELNPNPAQSAKNPNEMPFMHTLYQKNRDLRQRFLRFCI
jgi:hypothetical protein